MNTTDSDLEASVEENVNEKVDPQEFVTKASQKGVAEIEAAHTALEKAEINEVKEFAQRMIDDHSEANQKLKTIATQQGFEIEDDASLLDKAKKVALDLRVGESFDHAYIKKQISEHEKAIELFQDGSKTSNQYICDFAEEILPKLHEHLDQARLIQSSIT